MTSATTQPALSHISLHPDQPRTVLLLHGLHSGPQEFTNYSAPLLTQYHLLIPDLHNPQSTTTKTKTKTTMSPPSTPINPQPTFSLPSISLQLAELVRHHAHNGVASIVGCSLGGQLALYLAAHHPEILGNSDAVLASGLADFATFSPLTASAIPWFFTLESHVASAFGGVTKETKTPHPTTADTLRISREFLHTMRRDQDFAPVPARTLLVAATLNSWWSGKVGDSPVDALSIFNRITQVPESSANDSPNKSQIPTQASTKASDQVSDQVPTQVSNEVSDQVPMQSSRESKLVHIPCCSHPWNIQRPDLFAATLTAWLDQRALPSEVVIQT